MLSPGQAARVLGVTTQTLATFADRGVIQAVRLPSGHRRYLKSEIDALRDRDKRSALAEERS